MPLQNKKSSSSPTTESSRKLKKKKRKNSAKKSSKRASLSADSSSEGNTNIDSRRRHRNANINPSINGIKSNSSSGYDKTASSHDSRDTSSNVVTTSTSDGRSTSSSGENLVSLRFAASSSQSEFKTSKSETLVKSPSLVQVNESLRWADEYEDPDMESERLKLYKMNRRKRYLAYLQERVGGNTEKCYYA